VLECELVGFEVVDIFMTSEGVPGGAGRFQSGSWRFIPKRDYGVLVVKTRNNINLNYKSLIGQAKRPMINAIYDIDHIQFNLFQKRETYSHEGEGQVKRSKEG
jgi:hypothetical protein